VSRDTGKKPVSCRQLPDEALSPFGCGYLAGLLAHAAPRCHRVHHPDHQRATKR